MINIASLLKLPPELLASVLSAVGGQGPEQMNAGGAPPSLMPGPQPQAPQQAAPPMAPPAMAPAPAGITADDLALPTAHPNMLRRLQASLAEGGGATADKVAEIRDPGQARAQIELRAKQARMLFPNDQMKQFMWAQGDKDFRKALADRYKDEKLGPGDILARDGKELVRNAKTYGGVDGGYAYSGDDVRGIKFGPRRGKSYEETEKERSSRASEGVAQQRADQEGSKVDADIVNDTDKVAVERVVAKAAKDISSLTPGELQIFQAWVERQKRGAADDGFGAASTGEPAADGRTPAPPGGDPRLLRPRTRATASEAEATAEPPPAATAPPKGVKEGQTFKARGKTDGKLHRWGVVKGRTVDLGVVG